MYFCQCESFLSTSNSYNTPARDTLHLYDRARGPQARGRGHTNAMYPAAGVLSTNLCDNEWAYQRRAPMRMLSRLHLVVKKESNGGQEAQKRYFINGFKLEADISKLFFRL